MKTSRRFLVENRMPATVWQDATPLGNGRIGAMLYGCIYDERILLNHENLYDGAIELPLPDISNELSTVRELLNQKKYREADGHYVSKLKEKGYYAQTGDYIPTFDIHIITKTQKAFSNYSRILDMRNGVATVSWVDGEVDFSKEAFVDKESGLVVLKLKASLPVLNFQAKLEPHDLLDAVDYCGNKLTAEQLPKFNFSVGNNILNAELIALNGKKICAQMRIFSDGEVNLYNCKVPASLNDMQGTVAFKNNYFSVTNASQAVIVCSLYDYEETPVVLPDKDDFELWKENHTKKFSKHFDSMKLSLGTGGEKRCVEQQKVDSYNGKISLSQIEQMALFGRYLLISSSSNCKYPANLQGIWNGSYRPAWSSTFFNNENIEMNYWQACCGNLAETQLPLFDYYLMKMDDYRDNAKKLFGCRGILLPMFCDNTSGRKKNLQSHVVYWTASSSWISNIFFDYYLHTKDVKFLEEKAFPFMKESALFYEDFMQYDEKGVLKSYPSNSPENCAKGNFDGAENVRVCINATMDFATLKQLLIDLIQTEKILGVHDEKHNVWEKMLNAIPNYQINDDGALCEWMHPDFKDNYGHRHISHLYPIFPGREITKHDGKLFEACKRAVDLRCKLGLKEQTGWSFAHLANIWAKMGEGDRAKECLELLIRFCCGNNLFTYHNDYRNQGVTLKFLWAGHAPFQIDANFGFTSAVQQFLIDSTESQVEVFPALPEDWNKVEIGPCLTRCGVKVTAKYNGERAIIKLEALCDVTFRLESGIPLNLKYGEMKGDGLLLTLKKGEKAVVVGKKK